jgi:hypothetical protein
MEQKINNFISENNNGNEKRSYNNLPQTDPTTG